MTFRNLRLYAVLAMAPFTLACLPSFKAPLGPPEEGFIDPRLMGTWACVGSEDSKPTSLTIMDFDGKQYYIFGPGNGTDDPTHDRAIATRLGDSLFLSSHELGKDRQDDWTFMKYELTDPEHLKLSIVDPSPFEDIADDADAIRARLASRAEDPEVVLSAGISCTRHTEPANP